jgi:O-methyltransferase involved in polyketide biosynthesis
MENRNIQTSSLGNLERTLLIPLWARAKESQTENPVLIDHRAISILKDFDTAQLDGVFDEYYQLMYAVRAKMLDEEIKAFLTTCPSATIVNIGAGLDTSFERVDNGVVQWYDLDLPDVIELRTRFIPPTARNTCIAKSVFDSSWFEDIGKPVHGPMFVACGVLQYFREKEVRQLFANLATRFAGSEFVFDTSSKFFVWAGNWVVIWRSGMGTRSFMKWGINSAKSIAQWDKRFRIVAEYPLFSKIKMDESWSKKTVNAMRRADRMRGVGIAHLRFESQ